MYKILVLNQGSSEDFGREYSAFISALCLARMGHDVFYMGSERFAGEFYQGGYTKDVDIFDIQLPERPAQLPVGFECVFDKKLTLECLNSDKARDVIKMIGKVDVVAVSGVMTVPSYAKQVADHYDATVIHLDWNILLPCVNEIQVNRIRDCRSTARPIVTCITKALHYDTDVMEIREICHALGDYDLWLVGANLQGIDHESLHEERIFWQPSLTDSGRLNLLNQTTLFIQPNDHTRCSQTIAEALCMGVPVISRPMDGLHQYLDGFIMRPQDVDEKWIADVKSSMNTGQIMRKARYLFSFGTRIAALHVILSDLGCS